MVERLNPAGVPLPGLPGTVAPGTVRGGQPAAAPTRRETAAPTFADVLQSQLLQTVEGVRFSAHAQERLRARSIALSTTDLARIDDAVRRAAAKGARESLLLTDKAAFVVSVKNRTVITVVDSASMKENVFTNIDSAVIL